MLHRSLVLRKLVHFIAQLYCKQWLLFSLMKLIFAIQTHHHLHKSSYAISDVPHLKNDKNIKTIAFFKYMPSFSSWKWKHNEVAVVEGYCWVRARHSPSQSCLLLLGESKAQSLTVMPTSVNKVSTRILVNKI